MGLPSRLGCVCIFQCVRNSFYSSKKEKKKKSNRVWRVKNHNKDWFYLNNQIYIYIYIGYNSPTYAHV